MNPTTIGGLLTKAWQKIQGNDWDPANGQWYTNGANNDGMGLYGGISDTIDSVATVGVPSYGIDPGSLKQTIAIQSDVDNRDGLLTGPTMLTLSHTYATSQTFTHTTNSSVQVGVSQQYSLHIMIPGASVGVSTAISFDRTWSTSDATTETTSNSSTFQQTVPVMPPKGKVYRAMLTFIQNTATVPYWLNLHCSGRTETWYEDRWNGHFNWSNDAASLASQLNATDYVAMGLDPTQWGVDQSGIWTKGMTGTLTANLVGAFNVSVIDVTDEAPGFSVGDEIEVSQLSRMAVPAMAAA
jgi:hypothetical protein